MFSEFHDVPCIILYISWKLLKSIAAQVRIHRFRSFARALLELSKPHSTSIEHLSAIHSNDVS